ncbi:hypothetical protein AVEN_89725-1, partial [Araneus ventricosus]
MKLDVPSAGTLHCNPDSNFSSQQSCSNPALQICKLATSLTRKLALQSWCEFSHDIFTANFFCKWVGRLCFVTLQEVRCKLAVSSLSSSKSSTRIQIKCSGTLTLGNKKLASLREM